MFSITRNTIEEKDFECQSISDFQIESNLLSLILYAPWRGTERSKAAVASLSSFSRMEDVVYISLCPDQVDQLVYGIFFN